MQQTKILVIDDDPALCEFIQEVLLAEKVDAQVATDSVQAAMRLRKERFDAVFLDMRMPGLDGMELASCIRSSGLNQSTPLVMISGEQDSRLMQRAFKVGVNLFLFKPVDRTRLMRVLNAADNFIQAQHRRFARVKACQGVSIEMGERRITGTSLDLSIGGMFVRSSSTLPVGSEVRIALDLQPGKPPVKLSARVVRVCGNDCMGLRIEKTEAEEDKRLENFLLPLILAESDSQAAETHKFQSISH